MNVLDVVVILTVAAAAYGGYRIGFLTRAVSWIGMLVGLVLAARAVPLVLGDDASDGNATALVVAGLALLLAGALLGQAVGLVAGSRLRLALPSGRLRSVDRAGGALVAGVGVLATVWLVLPAMAETSVWPSSQAESSLVRRVLPEPPPALQTLRRIVGEDRFPRVFEADPDVEGPPPAELALTAVSLQEAARSVVLVRATACGQIQEGSGVVVGPDLVMTNGHVVAGADEIEIVRDDRKVIVVDLVALDPGRDLAVLRGEEIDRLALPRRRADLGDEGGVFGHPSGGDLTVSPFRIDRRLRARGDDLYGDPAPERDVLLLAADLEPGDSGAPLVDDGGALVGIAFAIAPDQDSVAYAVSIGEIESLLGGLDTARVVDSGPCLG
ncbi:MAG: MarP family serine protease [Actinomycetota bacterium]